MNMLPDLSQQPIILALGWTLLHFLWQGAALAALCSMLMLMMRSASPAARYRVAFACLLGLALLPVATFVYFVVGPLPMAHTGAGGALLAAANQNVAQNPGAALERNLQPYLPWLVLAWFAGVCMTASRTLAGWRRVHRLRCECDIRLAAPWFEALARLKARLHLDAPVQLAVSGLIRVPMVIGWLKPLVLIPPCVLAGLDARQIEMILAHELAHILRNDYLVNLVQTVIETLLFYHPAVRWISHQMRLEREKCCDQLVVEVSGDPVAYARALANLEAIRGTELGWGLGANGGALYDRVQTLVSPHHRAGGNGAAAALIVFAALIGAANLLRLPQNDARPALLVQRNSPTTLTPMPARAPTPAARATAQIAKSTGKVERHGGQQAATPPKTHRTAASSAAPAAGAKPQPSHARGHSLAKPRQKNVVPVQTRHATTPTHPAATNTIEATALAAAPAKLSETAAVSAADNGHRQSVDPASNIPSSMPMPAYPQSALIDGISGSVVVRVDVNTAGSVVDASTVSSSRAAFSNAVLAAVKAWQFPAGETRSLQFRFVFDTNLNAADCQAVTGTHICRMNAEAGKEVKGFIHVYTD
jgi:TonB family protein